MTPASSTDNVVRSPLFVEHQGGPAIEDMGPSLQEMVTQLANLCGTRVLGLIATLGAVGIFAYAIIDPAPWRMITATAYAVTVLLPTIVLYLKKG